MSGLNTNNLHSKLKIGVSHIKNLNKTYMKINLLFFDVHAYISTECHRIQLFSCQSFKSKVEQNLTLLQCKEPFTHLNNTFLYIQKKKRLSISFAYNQIWNERKSSNMLLKSSIFSLLCTWTEVQTVVQILNNNLSSDNNVLKLLKQTEIH